MGFNKKIIEILDGSSCVDVKGYTDKQLAEILKLPLSEVQERLDRMVIGGTIKPYNIDDIQIVYTLA